MKRSMLRIRYTITLLLGCLLSMNAVFADSQVLKLWEADGAAPGSENWQIAESVRDLGNGQQLITNVRIPELSVYLPKPELANGTAVVILPGGALRMLHIGNEISDNIAWLNGLGVAAFVLKYRTLQQAPESEREFVPPSEKSGKGKDTNSSAGASGAPPAMKWPTFEIKNANANPAPDNAELNTLLDLAINDGQQALRIIRTRAGAWNLDPDRVGMMGFSAGGGVALGTAVRNVEGAAPDFIVSLFGPSLMDVVVPEKAPPLFLATEADHGPVTDGLVELFKVWKQAGGSAELHIYQAQRLHNALWRDRFADWMEGFGYTRGRKAGD